MTVTQLEGQRWLHMETRDGCRSTVEHQNAIEIMIVSTDHVEHVWRQTHDLEQVQL